MRDYLSTISPIHVPPSRRKSPTSKSNESETDGIRRLCGELLWVGLSAVPQAFGIASKIQQRVPNLTEADLICANRCLHHLRASPASLKYLPHTRSFYNICLSTFPEAAFNCH